MSMIGSFVAATRSVIGNFDRIYTRITSNETISVQMSSFSIDLKQLTDALNGSTKKSLILIDELGRGTQLEDGQALVAAVVRYLIKSHSLVPHVFLTTNFYETLYMSRSFLTRHQHVHKLNFLSFQSIYKSRNL